MAGEHGHRSMLAILLAASERALEAFRAADNPVDAELVADIERVVERTRRELDALSAPDKSRGGAPS